MACLKEFTTWPQHQHLYYKVTGNAINFEVKSLWDAEIGLSKNLHKGNDYMIKLTHRSCSIVEEGGAKVSKNIRDLLSRVEYKQFWILWRNNTVAVGRHSKEYLRLEGVTKHLKYITFYVSNDHSWAEWKCYLPPVISNLPLKHFSGGEPEWTWPEEQVPDDAVLGGFENEGLYIMKAGHRQALNLGKFAPSVGMGLLSSGSGSHAEFDIQMLCGHNCTWVAARDGYVPAGAVPGGRSERRELVYVGRARIQGHLIPGKIQPSHRCCYVFYAEREIPVRKYEVLVTPAADERRVYARRRDGDSDSDS